MLSSDGADNVYPPAEDTHLLMDALEAETETFTRLGGENCYCLEIGFALQAMNVLILAPIEKTSLCSNN
jgi:hypothetical protein